MTTIPIEGTNYVWYDIEADSLEEADKIIQGEWFDNQLSNLEEKRIKLIGMHTEVDEEYDDTDFFDIAKLIRTPNGEHLDYLRRKDGSKNLSSDELYDAWRAAIETPPTKSRFTWRPIELQNTKFVIINDLFDENNPSMSVTNDIENVLAYINKELLDSGRMGIANYNICCQNTNKTWDYVKNHGNPEWIYTEVETLDLLISKIIGGVP